MSVADIKSPMTGSFSLFEEPYWLDCVAPGAWDAVEVWDGDQLAGRLPYFRKKAGRLSYLTNPPFTPRLSPWVNPCGGKYTNEISNQHKVLSELIEGLPTSSAAAISCAPEFTNLMPFHWNGFQLTLRYTYRLEDLQDLDRIWANLRENIRRECRKASKTIHVTSCGEFAQFRRKMEQEYKRHKTNVNPFLEALDRIEDVMAARRQRQIYLATDDSGQMHAGAYIVFDRRSAFYISGWSDHSLRTSGAHSAVLWEAIKGSADVTDIFDFDGSMIRPIERFFRAFGGRMVPYYEAQRQSGVASALRTARALWVLGRRSLQRTSLQPRLLSSK